MSPEHSAFAIQPHLEALAQRGYTIIEGLLSAEQLAAVREGLAPFLGSWRGRNDFEGTLTERVYTLVARGAVFEALAADPRVLALCDRLLLPGYLLTASQAICIHPGETPQPVHTDDGFYTVPRPRAPISLSTIVAVDAFSAENGGTEVIPGSHLWDDAQLQGLYDGRIDDAPLPESIARQLLPLEMAAGSCVFFYGTLAHRGGANRSTAPRLAYSNQYCQPWARTQENFFLGVPRERVQAMSERLQELLGFSIWPPFMGQVTASHPKKTLRADYVNAVQAGRAEPGR